jgi:predicted dehydrogenase
LGEFAELGATLYQSSDREYSLEDSFTLQFRLRNGIEGVMASTARAWSPRACERVVGTRGTLTVENGVVSISDKAGTRPVAVPAELARTPVHQDLSFVGENSRYHRTHMTNFDISSYIVQAREFADAILGWKSGPSLAADFRDGVAHMVLIEAVRESARTRRYVTIPEL